MRSGEKKGKVPLHNKHGADAVSRRRPRIALQARHTGVRNVKVGPFGSTFVTVCMRCACMRCVPLLQPLLHLSTERYSSRLDALPSCASLSLSVIRLDTTQCSQCPSEAPNLAPSARSARAGSARNAHKIKKNGDTHRPHTRHMWRFIFPRFQNGHKEAQ